MMDKQQELEAKVRALEKRVAELEVQVQAQPEVSEVNRIRRLSRDVYEKLETGEMSMNEAREAFGLEPLAENVTVIATRLAELEAQVQAQPTADAIIAKLHGHLAASARGIGPIG